MGKTTRRSGVHYQVERAYWEYASGKVYHPPLLKTEYWKEDPPAGVEAKPVKSAGKPKVVESIRAPDGLYKALKETDRQPKTRQKFQLIPLDPGSPPLSWAWLLHEDDPRSWLASRRVSQETVPEVRAEEKTQLQTSTVQSDRETLQHKIERKARVIKWLLTGETTQVGEPSD